MTYTPFKTLYRGFRKTGQKLHGCTRGGITLRKPTRRRRSDDGREWRARAVSKTPPVACRGRGENHLVYEKTGVRISEITLLQ